MCVYFVFNNVLYICDIGITRASFSIPQLMPMVLSSKSLSESFCSAIH